jgi:hypothetical protein
MHAGSRADPEAVRYSEARGEIIYYTLFIRAGWLCVY